METMDIIRIFMWIVSILLVPAFITLFNRVRALELKMETRVTVAAAAKMIADSNDKIDQRFDRLETLLIEDLKRRS